MLFESDSLKKNKHDSSLSKISNTIRFKESSMGISNHLNDSENSEGDEQTGIFDHLDEACGLQDNVFQKEDNFLARESLTSITRATN